MKFENKKFNRRNFLHKIVGITALGGIASLFLGQKVEKVSGALSGSISAGQIAYGTGVDTIGGIDDLKWNGGLHALVAGWNSTASGDYSTVVGKDNIAQRNHWKFQHDCLGKTDKER